eukprot:TRINITY_DN8566_c0_g1_i1.p1 TRINITY_DN8566_c0_g1~~TRINITY_DN8566_c0_g1_i1.p1  ORF type:complete len:139 (-),score=18.38 TRINITY_DN8566_c0_g1_i1:140-556(-)
MNRSTSDYIQLKAAKLPKQDLEVTNRVYLSPKDHFALSDPNPADPAWILRIILKGFVYIAEQHQDVAIGTIALGTFQRLTASIALGDLLDIAPFKNIQVDDRATNKDQSDASILSKGRIRCRGLESNHAREFFVSVSV